MKITYHRQEAYHGSRYLLEVMNAQRENLSRVETKNCAVKFSASATGYTLRLAKLPIEWYARIIRGTPPHAMRFRKTHDLTSVVDNLMYVTRRTLCNMFISMHSDGQKRQVLYGMSSEEFYLQLHKLNDELNRKQRPNDGNSIIAYVTEEALEGLHEMNLLLYISEPGYVLWKDVQ